MLAPFRAFFRKEASAGILLIIATLIAMIWANFGDGHGYDHFWHTPLSITLGSFSLSYSLQYWINDGLMAMFFFVVGLEIKREVMAGELSTLRKASLPLVAAIGGMVAPALFYAAFNVGGPGSSGWGIPMATDIAFALGVLTLFGKSIPTALKVFLAALAIGDDLGAVLVIAFFYSSNINYLDLIFGAGFMSILLACNYIGVRSPIVYAFFGIGGLWTAFLLSGVHPTVAGVLLAFTIPSQRRINSQQFLDHARPILDGFEKEFEDDDDPTDFLHPEQLSAILQLRRLYEHASTPLQRLEKTLHPWVVLVVMPIFALANAGVKLEATIAETLANPVALGIIFGLVAGKQIGIFTFSWALIKTGLAELPNRVTLLHLYGAACLGGIGFTMSLFIGGLAFPTGSELLPIAKVAVLIASIISGLMGWAVLAYAKKQESSNINLS